MDKRTSLSFEEPLRTSPERTEMYKARTMSSNIVIPSTISVSGLAVRFKSTNTFATMALEEKVVIPAITRISEIGNPETQPNNRPRVKLIPIYIVPPTRMDLPDLISRLTENSSPR
ncbi:hypothetical protein D3C73_1281180 [compost metagenome]